MATIVPIQNMQQQQQQIPQFQQQQQTAAQDPLFEALAKYITGGPGPSSVTTAEIQEILDAHTQQQGGRAYLESIVNPTPDTQIKIWKNHAKARGFVSTDIGTMTLDFTTSKPMSLGKVSFRGTVPGFFPPQVFTFDDEAKFYWDDLADNTPARMEVTMLQHVSILTVRFYSGNNQAIGELLVNKATMRLPEHALNGNGVFSVIDGP